MYFSEKQKEPAPRQNERIDETVWNGLRTVINERIKDGSFGAHYSKTCDDNICDIIGTDGRALMDAMRAEIPSLPENILGSGGFEMIDTRDILDLIEFCWRCVRKPIRCYYHEHFRHHHLDFDEMAGREQFRDAVNRILRRNGLIYELTEEGNIKRLASPVLNTIISSPLETGNVDLDNMLKKAVEKFLDPDNDTRRESLEALWDAWERLKTLDGSDKKTQTGRLVDTAAGSSNSKFRTFLEKEAGEITQIGNSLQIRHSETYQERVEKTTHVNYLFHRLYSFIDLVVKEKKAYAAAAMSSGARASSNGAVS